MITLAWPLVTCICVLDVVHLSVFILLGVFSGGGAAGEVDLLSLIKTGPSIQTSLSAKAMAESPLVGRSAGLTVPGIYRH